MLIAHQPHEFPARTDTTAPRILVPTMGALHAGHLALITHAREIAGPHGQVAVSIFVNPIQFDRPEDFDHYPRTLESDLDQCRDTGADLVFAPNANTMYPPDHSTQVLESSLSKNLCGRTRPGHFDGVCTVVLKLFNLIQPTAAIFGEKDFQQLAIIRRMGRDLNLPVEIISHPTLREPDGLAMSSRNARLTRDQRADAPRIRRALLAAAEKAATNRSTHDILQTARDHLESPALTIDYLEIVDAETLQPTTTLTHPSILAAAVFYDKVRLIDHITLPTHS